MMDTHSQGRSFCAPCTEEESRSYTLLTLLRPPPRPLPPFSLFLTEEYIGLDERAYVGDILAEIAAAMERNERQGGSRLLLRKKFFRENEEAIADPVFVQLSYLQVGARLKDEVECTQVLHLKPEQSIKEVIANHVNSQLTYQMRVGA